MEQPAKLKEEINVSNNLKLLTKAYQEHAIEQINFARYSVLASRDFVQQLAAIFFNVKASYRKALTAHNTPMGRKMTKNLNKNGKEAIVLLTANTKLYGDIIPKVSRAFLETAKISSADIIVIGKQGKNYFDEARIKKPYQFFEIPDTNVSLSLIKNLTSTLIVYEKVHVFYGKFNNIISQNPVETSITGDLPIEQEQEKNESQEDFLFEPNLDEVAVFFEDQIFSLLFAQTINEAQLGKFASRITAMERAQNNMEKQLETLLRRQVRLKNLMNNKKQLELLAGRSLWGKR